MTWTDSGPRAPPLRHLMPETSGATSDNQMAPMISEISQSFSLHPQALVFTDNRARTPSGTDYFRVGSGLS
jgi:hypothetical protein